MNKYGHIVKALRQGQAETIAFLDIWELTKVGDLFHWRGADHLKVSDTEYLDKGTKVDISGWRFITNVNSLLELP